MPLPDEHVGGGVGATHGRRPEQAAVGLHGVGQVVAVAEATAAQHDRENDYHTMPTDGASLYPHLVNPMSSNVKRRLSLLTLCCPPSYHVPTQIMLVSAPEAELLGQVQVPPLRRYLGYLYLPYLPTHLPTYPPVEPASVMYPSTHLK